MFTAFSMALIRIPSDLKAGVFHQSIGGYSRPVRTIAFPSSKNMPPLYKMMRTDDHKLGYVNSTQKFYADGILLSCISAS
jgi:hypothetical protein